MYLTYFALNEPPFSIPPDPRFVYLGRQHEDALAHQLIQGTAPEIIRDRLASGRLLGQG